MSMQYSSRFLLSSSAAITSKGMLLLGMRLYGSVKECSRYDPVSQKYKRLWISG